MTARARRARPRRCGARTRRRTPRCARSRAGAGALRAATRVRVIVRLAPPPLALVAPGRRQLMGVGSVGRLDAASFGSRLYLAHLRRVQDAFAARLRSRVPGAAVERRYRRRARRPGAAAAGALAGARRAAARRRGRLSGRDLPRPDRHGARARGRRSALGRRPLDRRPGHQGRRDRRRHRRRRAVPGARRPARARRASRAGSGASRAAA